MRRRDMPISLLAVLCLSGCATSALKLAPERPDKPWVPVTTANAEIIPGKQQAPATAAGFVLPGNPALASDDASPSVDAARTYSLPELINLAESNNPATRIVWNDARRAALAAGIAESAFLPKITASAIGGYQTVSGNQTVALQSSPGVNFANSGSLSGTISAISLQWLLFDFGERAALVDAAQQASLISNIAFTAAHQQLIHNVAVAFYRHAAAQARLTTASQSLKNSLAIQAAAEDRYKQGIGTVVEAAQARQGTAQANLALVQASGGVQDTYLSLVTALGISPFTKMKIASVSGRTLSPSMMAPVESIIQEALSRRPDMQSAYAAQKASLAKMKAAQAAFMPKLFVSATGTYNSGNLNVTAIPSVGEQLPTLNVSGNQFGGTILGGVSFPLYDGGTRSAALAQARIDVESAKARMAQTRDEAVRQIVLADNALRTSLAAHAAAQTLVQAAQTTFDAALAAYRNGVGSVTDATLAETQLFQARYAESDAYSSALAAAATLALATGALGSSPS